MLLVILQSSLDWVKYLVSRYASIDSNQNCQGTNKVPSIFNFILYGNPTKQNVGIDSVYSTIHRYICTHIRMCRYINQLLNGISAAAAFSQLECRERRRQKANHWKMLPILLKLAVFAQIKLITNSDANWKRTQRESRAGEWEHRMLQQRTRRLTWTHISLHVSVVVFVCSSAQLTLSEREHTKSAYKCGKFMPQFCQCRKTSKLFSTFSWVKWSTRVNCSTLCLLKTHVRSTQLAVWFALSGTRLNGTLSRKIIAYYKIIFYIYSGSTFLLCLPCW